MGVTLHDGSGRVSVVSAAAARLLGVDQAELVGRASLFDANAAVPEPAILALQTGSPQRATMLRYTAGRGTLWFEVTAQPLFKVGATMPYAAVTRFKPLRPSR